MVDDCAQLPANFDGANKRFLLTNVINFCLY